ncbi:MAG: hypothetical protein HY537_05690 [Deltaproteobacteria bacterium]|nr:hypothetical protein [Deltaproteobacteria bacterium]
MKINQPIYLLFLLIFTSSAQPLRSEMPDPAQGPSDPSWSTANASAYGVADPYSPQSQAPSELSYGGPQQNPPNPYGQDPYAQQASPYSMDPSQQPGSTWDPASQFYAPPPTEMNDPSTMGTPAESAGASNVPSDGTQATSEQAAPGDNDQASLTKQTVLNRFLEKLRKKNGDLATMAILRPIDNTAGKLSDAVGETALKALSRYGNIKIRQKSDVLNSLTLEQFRQKTIQHDSEIVVQIVIQPTNMDMFFYDRRTPYFIYAYSQELPDPNVYRLTPSVAGHYTKLLVRRTLYRYAQDQFYELPREVANPVIPEDIPRRIASLENIVKYNRELRHRFYFSGNIGAALSRGESGKFWNSSLVSFQLAFRPFGRIFIEAEAEAFAYYALVASIKYMFFLKDSPVRFSAGLGAAYISARKTIDWDQTNGLGWESYYIAPSAAILFPVGDIHFKGETKLMVGLSQPNIVFTIMPGLLISF